MIPASGAGGPGFDSRLRPFFFVLFCYSDNDSPHHHYAMKKAIVSIVSFVSAILLHGASELFYEV